MIESVGRAFSSPRSRASVALVSTAVLLAGCGSGGDSTTAAAGSTKIPAALAGAFPGKKATGAPVRIGLITNEGGSAISQPETREAAQAAMKYANADLGGIAGRPIEFVICKTKEEPATARDCANQMVEQKVDAVVLTSSGLGDSMVPIVTQAGIPWTTAIAASNSEGTTANAFSWTGGFPTTMTSMAAYAKDKGYKKVAAFVIDAPAAVSGIEAIGKPVFARAGVGLQIVTVAAGTPDASPQVSAALQNKPDAVAVVADPTVCTSVLQAMGTLGAGIARMTVQSCVSPEVVSAVGAGMDGVQVFSSFDVASDDLEAQLYRQVMKEYSPGTSATGYAAIGYQGVLALVRALHGLTGTVTPKTITAALHSAKNIVLPAGHGITFTCDAKAVPGLPSACSAKEVTGTVSDGKLGQMRVVDPSPLFAR
ncbi:ABC transporter substrate-binding protein [Streptomyces sp. NRRL F-525]|uniref:ABC transporter substrate-binding protein n=1 Tax=Streptomyces sp. NRRL F-525 TaxID=1463861 RepID=UPI000AE68FD7|nr:ABC transporter substrate-binding protein [Streptomyces sp. NRRL F-525]